jgi:hypothetical protein
VSLYRSPLHLFFGLAGAPSGLPDTLPVPSADGLIRLLPLKEEEGEGREKRRLSIPRGGAGRARGEEEE